MILKSIGLMSGTSMDGIEAVLMETDGQGTINSIVTASLAYSVEFILSLRTEELLVRKAKNNIASLDVIKRSTELHAELVSILLKKANLIPSDIDIIGYHGQALYHNPAEGITIQIGDGQLLADLTGIAVINDFRSNDIANGGQGAPLAPLYHQALAIKSSYFPVAVVNCGGIANISIVYGPDKVEGFDTGPGNVLIDRYIRHKTNNAELMDFNGKYGFNGVVNQKILEKLAERLSSYLNKKPPKSLDPGDLDLIEELDTLSINDACATLENFTAKCIVESVSNLPSKWVLAGGGWNNPVITKYLKQYLAEKIDHPDIKIAQEINWDGVHMEAEIFAFLAVRSLHKLPITLPSTTGAKTPTFGGHAYLPSARPINKNIQGLIERNPEVLEGYKRNIK